jgi:mono/diheme cytochrome c family protein
MNRTLKVVLGALAVGFIAIQFVPVQRTNPPVQQEPPWDSAETKALFDRACADCHSNQTQWPPYAYVAPVSWLVVHDTNEGRRALNVSEWNAVRGKSKMAEEARDLINSGEMPMTIYLPLHPEANLSAEEKAKLIVGLEKSFK